MKFNPPKDIEKIAQYAIRKVAGAQGPNDQEENALWADFYDCLQEAAKSECGTTIPDLSQDMVESFK